LISAFFYILFHPFGLFCMYVETWIEYFGGVIKIQYFIFYFSEQTIPIEGVDPQWFARLDQEIRDGCEQIVTER
jgi:hypothetical protein